MGEQHNYVLSCCAISFPPGVWFGVLNLTGTILAISILSKSGKFQFTKCAFYLFFCV